MLLYNIGLILPLFFYFFCTVFMKKPDAEILERKLAWLMFIWFLVLFGFRDVSVGTDLFRYAARYTRIGNSEWSELSRINSAWNFEFGYVIFNKLLAYISDNPKLLIFVTTLIVEGGFFRAILKYSKYPCFSYYIFNLFIFNYTSVNLIRLFIAISICLFALDFIEKKKPVFFVLLVVLAFFFHSSALAFLLVYPVSRLKINQITLLVVFVVSGLLYVFSTKIIQLAFQFVSYYASRYEDDLGTGDGWGMLLLILGITVFCFLYRNDAEQSDSRFPIWFSMLLLSFFFGVIALRLTIAARIMWFFKVVLIFLVPNMMAMFTEKKKSLEKLIFFAMTCVVPWVYYLSSVNADYFGILPYVWGF